MREKSVRSTAISSTLEDYLEAILRLVRTKTAARARDIADALGVHRSTVTAALKSLAERGLIHYAPYEVVTLTDNGVRAAEDVLRRHEALRTFFIDVLRVSPDIAEKAACSMEHSVPPEVIRRMAELRQVIDECPRAGPGWVDRVLARCHDEGECETCLRDSVAEGRRGRKKKEAGMTVGLATLGVGSKGRVASMKCGPELRKRLAEMGVTTGTRIEVERVAPLGDPIEVRVRGYCMSLRKEEAAGIAVTVEAE